MRQLPITPFRAYLLAWLLLVISALPPAVAAAQAHTLRVTIRDTGGRGLAGIVVVVRSEEGQELARQPSDAVGMASFAELPGVVRVGVEGQARGGPPLYQLGDDALGVRVDLGQAEEQAGLNLRVERDGLTLPDPATMLTLEEGGPVVVETEPVPTAALATPAPLPTAPDTATQPAVIAGMPPSEEPRHAGWAPLVTVLVIAIAAGVMLLIQRRRSAP
jgi:hypothetical protein